MVRGKTLHNELFGEAERTVVIKENGRSKEKIKQRNEALLHRYYYYSLITKWRYDYILLKVSNEFYLSVIMVSKIIMANVDEISKIKKEKPSISVLKKQHPHFDWPSKIN